MPTFSELNKLYLKLCCKNYYKINLLHQIVVPQVSGGWQHNYSTKTRQAGYANEQSIYSKLSMTKTLAMTTGIRLDYRLKITNALAYYKKAYISKPW